MKFANWLFLHTFIPEIRIAIAKSLVPQELEGLVTFTTSIHTQKLYALVKKDAYFDEAEVNNTTAMNTELIMNAFYNAIFPLAGMVQEASNEIGRNP